MRTRILFALTLLIAVVSTAALALAGDDSAPAAGDATRCLPEAVDCVDTPGQAEEPGNGTAMCLPDVPDCSDVVVDDGAEAPQDQFDADTARERARALLGADETEVAAADARVGRRGAEHMMLTEDYVLGRVTVELDDDGTGTFRVTAVTVELPDGPETMVS